MQPYESSNMIQRVFNVKPGYDCTVKCEHDRKGAHGIHCTEWVYTVVNRDAHIALELEVYTPFYPESVQPKSYIHNLLEQKPYTGTFLRWHFGYATTREQVKTRPDASNCEFIGRCWADGSGLAAEPLVAKHFERNYEGGWHRLGAEQLTEQPALWVALEQKLHTLLEQLEAARREDGDLKWSVCRKCEGAGTHALESITLKDYTRP
jgi:hypothetical protein